MKLIRNTANQNLNDIIPDESGNLVKSLENIELRTIKRLVTKDGFLQASKNLKIGQTILIDKGTAQIQEITDLEGRVRRYEVVSQVDGNGKPVINNQGESISWFPVDFISD